MKHTIYHSHACNHLETCISNVQVSTHRAFKYEPVVFKLKIIKLSGIHLLMYSSIDNPIANRIATNDPADAPRNNTRSNHMSLVSIDAHPFAMRSDILNQKNMLNTYKISS